ncbi:MAG: NAD-dependent epimerase/dehydratase family protein [Acidimicrobiales bacterium]
MRRAVLLGGTGAIGFATARRLAAAGWEVVVTGRDPAHVPVGLAASGVRFVRADRRDQATLAGVLAAGVDLVVDCVCYTAASAAELVPFLGDVTCTVMISSKAVYTDTQDRHSNSEEPPAFDAPITEEQPTLRPNGADYDSREGYGPNKVRGDPARQRPCRHRAAGVDGPWRVEPPAAGVALRQTRPRSPARRAPLPPGIRR